MPIYFQAVSLCVLWEALPSHPICQTGPVPWLSPPAPETPYFICDGTDFQLRVYEDHVGTGTVTANEDGTYTLDLNNSDTDVTAIIEGNTLDLVFPSGRMLTFEAE